jgi:protein phosphatase
MLATRYAAASDQGRVRQRNEDNWTAIPSRGLFIVADGIGGHAAGDLASRIAVEALPGLIFNHVDSTEHSGAYLSADAVVAAFCTLNREIVERTKGEPGLESLGTTVALVMIGSGSALVVHLGDSRAYLFRAGELELLTRDHSVVQLLMNEGEIAPEDADHHPSRGQLTRFLGMDGDPLPDVCSIDISVGDRLLLCTDGLTNMVSHANIGSILSQERVAESACHQLISTANAAGGEDNITVVVIDLLEEQEELL